MENNKDLGFSVFMQKVGLTPEQQAAVLNEAKMREELESWLSGEISSLRNVYGLVPQHQELPEHADYYLGMNMGYFEQLATEYLKERGVYVSYHDLYNTRCAGITTTNPDYMVSVNYYPLANDRTVLTINYKHSTIQRIECFPNTPPKYLED